MITPAFETLGIVKKACEAYTRHKDAVTYAVCVEVSLDPNDESRAIDGRLIYLFYLTEAGSTGSGSADQTRQGSS